MSHSKSPYEIRLDLLCLAHDILKGQKEAKAAANTVEETVVYVTEAPTAEEVITEATKLNGFVSQSTNQ